MKKNLNEEIIINLFQKYLTIAALFKIIRI